MKYRVAWKRKIDKDLKKLPPEVQKLFKMLVNDIKEKGAIQKGWRNFSDLGENKYHCHLNYSYVACWYYDKNTDSYLVEVTYVGSRENAPY